jgi:hypothetical protein
LSEPLVCLEKKIIIEVDGGQHAVETKKDRKRDEWTKSQGFKVLRFWNNEVLNNTQGVLEAVRINCLLHPPLNPLPSREGKKERNFHQVRGKKERNSHQGRGIYPFEMGKNQKIELNFLQTRKKSFASHFGHFWKVIHEMLSVKIAKLFEALKPAFSNLLKHLKSLFSVSSLKKVF